MQQPGTHSDQYETRRIEVAWGRQTIRFLAVPNKNVSFIGDFSIETPISRGFPIAMFDYRRVLVLSPFLISIHCKHGSASFPIQEISTEGSKPIICYFSRCIPSHQTHHPSTSPFEEATKAIMELCQDVRPNHLEMSTSQDLPCGMW